MITSHADVLELDIVDVQKLVASQFEVDEGLADRWHQPQDIFLRRHGTVEELVYFIWDVVRHQHSAIFVEVITSDGVCPICLYDVEGGYGYVGLTKCGEVLTDIKGFMPSAICTVCNEVDDKWIECAIVLPDLCPTVGSKLVPRFCGIKRRTEDAQNTDS